MSDTALRTGADGRLSLSHMGLLAALAIAFPATSAGAADNASTYVQRNLMSDGSIPADHTDPAFIAPWGITPAAGGSLRIVGNGTSASAAYDAQGNALLSPPAVDIPGGSPTGIARNDGADFALPCPDGTLAPSAFLFATEAGIISGWTAKANAESAIAVVDNSEDGAVYKGIAIATQGSGRFLYATDFHNARVDVFDTNFRPVQMPAGAFKDPNLPAGFAPFGIQAISGKLYVTYAKQDDAKQDSVNGPGLGFVDIYEPDGHLIRRLVSRGRLNAPWGMALAPADFGQFGNHLLVANFGDGHINAYHPSTGEFKGQLRGIDNRPLAIDGLSGICFGPGSPGQATSALFFTAGPAYENQGLYGRIEWAERLLAASGTVTGPVKPQAHEHRLGGTEASEAALQEVKADEGGKGEEPPRNKDGAPLDPQGQGQQNEAAGQDADSALSIHAPKTPD